jgi:hypothetical protein
MFLNGLANDGCGGEGRNDGGGTRIGGCDEGDGRECGVRSCRDG